MPVLALPTTLCEARRMGWFFEDVTGHEGGAIGYVTREGCPPDAELYRELAYPRDDITRRVVRLAAGCECGWRSSRWAPRQPASWEPFGVSVSKVDDECARQLWRRHLELDVIPGDPLHDAATTQAELVPLGARAAEALVTADIVDLAHHRPR